PVGHLDAVRTASEHRLLRVEAALAAGHSVEEVSAASSIDPWFIGQIRLMLDAANTLRGTDIGKVSAEDLRSAKRRGISDRRIALLTGASEADVRLVRQLLGVVPVHKTVDTCAGE